MERDFNTKVEFCDSSELIKKTASLELSWLQALLLRVGVPTVLIDKALHDPNYGLETWRDYLFDEKGLIITSNLSDRSVDVFQVNFSSGEKVKIASWNKPIVSRIRKEAKIICRVELQYWQIV